MIQFSYGTEIILRRTIMNKSIGQIIRQLRLERNITQEELAELISVTPQAISKWEREVGYPDIIQIVPLANVFGVSTDVLFGVFGTNDDEEVKKIISEAADPLEKFDTPDYTDYDCYLKLKEGLKKYPNNVKLLNKTLAYAMFIATQYRIENPDIAKVAYNDCLKYSNMIIKYSNDVNEILSAHTSMLHLHCRYKEFDKAREHANAFPYRFYENKLCAEATISTFEKDYDKDIETRTQILSGLLMVVDFSIIPLIEDYKRKGQYEDAISVGKTILNIVKSVYGEEKYTPPMHDAYFLYFQLAHTSILLGDIDGAFEYLEEQYEICKVYLEKFNKVKSFDNIASIRFETFEFANDNYHIEYYIEHFDWSAYDPIRNDERFITIYEKAKKLLK